MTHTRLAAVRSALAEAQIDGLLITSAANRRYLSGFTGSAGTIILDADRALLLTDGRYTEQAHEQAPEFEIITRDLAERLVDCVARHVAPIKRLGFEANALTVAEHEELQKPMNGVELVATNGLVEHARRIKDAEELGRLRRAIAITDQALMQVRGILRPAMTEREAAWKMRTAIHDLGGDDLSFNTIVAAGPNGARPHAFPGDQQLGTGRPIVIDCGALIGGYHADATRTLILGHADEQFWRIYNTVRDALETARARIRPGTTGQQADALARDVIEAAGYGEAFGHGLGHGVGLDIHEQPSLRKSAEDALPIGAVFSIEPGIYLPEWGGVRLEDLVLLREDGVETLTQSPLDDPVVTL